MSLRLHNDSDSGDPESMTPEERRDELASVFARSVVCLEMGRQGACVRQGGAETRQPSAEWGFAAPRGSILQEPNPVRLGAAQRCCEFDPMESVRTHPPLATRRRCVSAARLRSST